MNHHLSASNEVASATMRVSNLAIMMLTELAVTESTLRRCSASTPSHALALINLLPHRARSWLTLLAGLFSIFGAWIESSLWPIDTWVGINPVSAALNDF